MRLMKFNKKDLKKAISHLRKDSLMEKLIKEYKIDEWGKYGSSLFVDIIDAIISQQLSSKASQSISKRFKDFFNNKAINPSDVLKESSEKLRACGLSFTKVSYIQGLAKAVNQRELDLEKLAELSDEQVKAELTKIRGIGKWTAEMILLFSLQRPDIFSLGDLGLRTAVSRLYKIDRNNLGKIEEISLTWSPYRSFASRYLWKSLSKRP